MTNQSQPSKKARATRKSPIRWEAVAPVAIITALIWAYTALFMDRHLRKAIEYGATRAIGAEVNVASVSTSFWNASLEIRGLQATDADFPERNLFEIERVHWQMLWDALLRGKIAIVDAAIDGVALRTKRTVPGRVLPKPPQLEHSAIEALKNRTLDQAEKEFDRNVLGDAAALLKGGDPQQRLKDLEGSLKSSARIKELEEELKIKQKEWDARIAHLPQEKELQSYDARLKSVKLSGFSNPTEVQHSLQELTSIYSDVASKFNEIKATGESLGKDLSTYQAAIKSLEPLIQSDIKELESRLQIPKIDAESLARVLFGPQLVAKLKKAEFYMNKARAYIPPKKSKAELETERAENAVALSTPRERNKGRNYVFGRPHSYPLFWLKRAAISSKATPGGLAGDAKGEIRDVTNDQSVLGLPLTASLQGEFAAQNIHGAALELLIDHRGEVPIESVSARIGEYALSRQSLIDSPDAKLGFDRASGRADFKAQFNGAHVEITSSGSFEKIAYAVEAKEPILAAILKGAVADIPKVTYSAGVGGIWNDLKFSIDSNLGRELGAALQKQLQAEINEARAQLKKLVDERINIEKAKFTAEYKRATDRVNSAISAKEAELDAAKKRIDIAKNEAVKGQTKGLEDQGKKAIEDLKKQFHF